MVSTSPTGLGDQNTLPGVPSYIIRVLNDLETEKLPFNWTLQKNVEGFSLSLKFPANPVKTRKNGRHLGNVNKDTQPRKQEHSKTTSSAVPNRPPIHSADIQRRKSPSCRRRDRNRLVSWRRRKKSPTPRPLETEPPRGTDADPKGKDSLPVTGPVLSGNPQEGTDADPKVQDSLPIVVPRDNPPHNQSAQSETDAVSKCEIDPNRTESETDNLSNCEIDSDPNQPEIDNLSLKSETSLVNDTTLSSNQSLEPDEIWSFSECSYCGKPDSECDLQDCSRCTLTQYCSTSCQTADWEEEHGVICKPKITSCYNCFETYAESELKACSRCKSVRYCSRSCQAANWKGHKIFCIAPSVTTV